MEAVGRVFAAVPLSPGARLDLADQLRDLDIPGRRVPVENWHLTLRFLGTIDESTFERFLHGLSRRELPRTFLVSLGGLGGFPNPRRATVVWIGVEAGVDQLAVLNDIAEESAQAAGLDPEERPYRPHLTLSRVRPPQGMGHLLGADVQVRYQADRLVVYKSHMGRGGASYEPLEEFMLG